MIGLSTTAFKGDDIEGWLEDVEKLGFDYIEWVCEWPRFLDQNLFEKLKELMSSFNLPLTLHAPFSDLNVASFNEIIRKASMGAVEKALHRAVDLGAVAVTIHPGHCSPVSRKYPKEYLRIHRSSLEKIARTAEELGVNVGVENMPRFPILDAQTPERLKNIIDGIPIGVTFDVAHLNTTGADFEGFITNFKDRVIVLHLHDNHGSEDEHLALGEGNIPWEVLLPKLPKVPATIEVKNLRDAEKSIALLKSLHW